MVQKIVLIAMLFVGAFVFIGCHTTEGLGEDIQWTGEKIEEAAD